MIFRNAEAVNKTMKRTSLFRLTLFIGSLLLFSNPQTAQADVGRDMGLILRGVGKTVGSAVLIPMDMLAGSTRAFPFGIVASAISGTARAVMSTLSGTVDIARGAAPYAKYLIFL